MNNKILVIFDQEEDYAIRLSEYLRKKGNMPFQIQVFTKKEIFQKFNKKYKIDILMIAEASFFQEANEIKALCKVLLTDRGKCEMEGFSAIRKYQSSDKIWKEIVRLCDVESSLLFSERKKTNIIGIYTPIGRCLQTSFALLLGQMLAKKKNVLYLNFEPFAGYGRFIKSNGKEELTNLMYFISNAKDKFFPQFQSSIRSVNGMDYIPPAYSFIDLSIITAEQWIMLIDIIITECSYDYLILDLSDNLQGLLQILENCDNVYTITRDDGISMAKINQYEKLVSETEYCGIIEKTKRFRFPEFRNIPFEMEQLPFCELAKYVKSIIKEDLDEQLSEV